MGKDSPEKSGVRVIYVKAFRHWRTGKIIHAGAFGKKAFRIEVKE